MKPCVMKFGGTSLKNRQTRQYAYQKIINQASKSKVVVVVSAMGKGLDPYASDTLLQFASSKLSKKDEIRLLSIGELLSSIVVCSELLDLGMNVTTLSFKEAGIIVNDCNINLDKTKMIEALQQYDIVVVGGFIAIDKQQQLVCLGRGGSDYSAVLFAHMLAVDEVYIYTDVDGIYNQDPKNHLNAIKYREISYDTLLKMNAKVVAKSCIIYAKQYHIKLYVLSTFCDKDGSIVKS